MQQPRKPDYVLLTAIGILVAFGLVMVYSSSFVVAYTEFGTLNYWVVRQALWAVCGIIGLLVAMRLDYRYLRRVSIPLMLLTLVLLVLVLVLPDSITVVNGAARWIDFGFFSVQPSEIAKFAAIIYFSDWLSRRGSKIRRFMTGLLPFGIMLGLLAGLVLLEPDMGTTVVIVLISAAILFSSGASVFHLGTAAVLTLSVGWIAIQSAAYRLERFQVWQNPWAYAREGGHQPIHALYALGSGGWTGVGLGQSRQKFHWLPFAHTDAIFAVIGEELGLIGSLFILSLIIIIAIRGFRLATRSLDPFGSLIAVGVTTWLVGQALINIAVVSTLIPFTGITFPFISYGGSSLLMVLIAAGLLLSVSRYAPMKHTEDLIHEQAFPSFQRFQLQLSAFTDALRRRNGRSRVSSARHSQRTTERDLPSSVAVGTSISSGWRKRVANPKQHNKRSRY